MPAEVLTKELPIHRVSELFPALTPTEKKRLRDSIEANGVQDDVIVWNDQVLDGKHRMRFAVELGVPLPVLRFKGTEAEAVELAVSKQLGRRNLQESQRAMVANRLSELQDRLAPAASANGDGAAHADAPTARPARKKGGRISAAERKAGRVSRKEAARAMKVGERSVARASVVQDKGCDELTAAVDQGRVKLAWARKVADLPHDEQKEALQERLAAKAKRATGGREAERQNEWLADIKNDAEAMRPRQVQMGRSLANMAVKLGAVVAYFEALAGMDNAGAFVEDGVVTEARAAAKKLTNLARMVQASTAYGDCPNCAKKNTHGCKACRGQGWVPRSTFEQAPEEQRAVAKVYS